MCFLCGTIKKSFSIKCIQITKVSIIAPVYSIVLLFLKKNDQYRFCHECDVLGLLYLLFFFLYYARRMLMEMDPWIMENL